MIHKKPPCTWDSGNFLQGTNAKGRGCQPELHVKIAQCCADLSLYTEALAELEAIEKPARTLKVHNAVARLYRRLGKKAAAIAAYQVSSVALHTFHVRFMPLNSIAGMSGPPDVQTDIIQLFWPKHLSASAFMQECLRLCPYAVEALQALTEMDCPTKDLVALMPKSQSQSPQVCSPHAACMCIMTYC